MKHELETIDCHPIPINSALNFFCLHSRFLYVWLTSFSLLVQGTSEVMILVSVSGVVEYELDRKPNQTENFHQSFILAPDLCSTQKNACYIVSDCFRSMKSTN
jgi:hypothetical protein